MTEITKSEVTDRIASISNLVSFMENLPQIDAPVKHHFSDGVYAREIFMPKGMLIVGKVHKTRHLNIVSEGRCRVVTPTRKFDIVAPFTFESFAGEQKVVLMHEDVVWTTIHITTETDLDVIEDKCIAKEFDKELVDNLVKSFGGDLCLGDS